jgi:hypothetical protein
VVMLSGKDLGERFLTKLAKFKRRPAQGYPKLVSVYENLMKVEEAKGVCKDHSK